MDSKFKVGDEVLIDPVDGGIREAKVVSHTSPVVGPIEAIVEFEHLGKTRTARFGDHRMMLKEDPSAISKAEGLVEEFQDIAGVEGRECAVLCCKKLLHASYGCGDTLFWHSVLNYLKK